MNVLLMLGEKTGAEAGAAGGKLPSAADLSGIAQRHYLKEGSGAEPIAWKLAFEHDYEDVFNKGIKRKTLGERSESDKVRVSRHVR